MGEFVKEKSEKKREKHVLKVHDTNIENMFQPVHHFEKSKVLFDNSIQYLNLLASDFNTFRRV